MDFRPTKAVYGIVAALFGVLCLLGAVGEAAESEGRNEWGGAGLPNLTDYPHTGWTYSLVPQNNTGCNGTSCPLPADLYGTLTVYLNFAEINNGTEAAGFHTNRFFLDDVLVGASNMGLIQAGIALCVVDLGVGNVRGGRHTLKAHIDFFDEVAESNETEADNIESHQFVWSPGPLSDDTPLERSSPPIKGAVPYNNDGFSFYVNNSGNDKYWSAVGMLQYSSGADYDIMLWDIGDYTGSEGGFGSGHLEWSAHPVGLSDFVIVNRNNAASGNYYGAVLNWNLGSGNFRVEEATSKFITTRPGTQWNGPYDKTATNVLDVYEVELYAGTYYFVLDQVAGACNLGMTLYDDETVTAGKSKYMTTGYADSAGAGGDEAFLITIPDFGFHGLVVWKVGYSDYDKACSYRIAVGPPAITVTYPNGSETLYIGSTYNLTWDSFGPAATIGSSVKIEISRDGGDSWSTIVASTANDGIHPWTVTEPNSSQCRIRVTSTTNSSYTDISNTNFTIADVCECDLNHDGSCNILDYQLFIQDWGRTNCGTPPGTGLPPNDCECDLNKDGKCNILDYQLFIQDWGRTNCPL